MQIMVDVGAGQGLFSLAAAARGHRALAFELSRKSVASFNASIHFNGFQQHIALREVCPWLLSPFQSSAYIWLSPPGAACMCTFFARPLICHRDGLASVRGMLCCSAGHRAQD